jgi:hypothetical protein
VRSRAHLKTWANFIAYEAVWFATIYLAGRWAQTLALAPPMTRELVP